MTLALFLSPHLDDAVLSCAGRIQRHVARGDRVVLLTAFSHADPRDLADWAARRREDETAAARVGATTRWLGLPDAPFRDPLYASFTAPALTGPLAAADAWWRARLVTRLRHELEALAPARLYVPLGVGEHVDHRLVHEAAAALAFTPREYYEDQPYALVSEAVQHRLAALDLVPVHTELESLDDSAASLAEQAIWDYASQVHVLFGTREHYRSQQRAHAERLGTSAARAERYWQLTPRTHPAGCR